MACGPCGHDKHDTKCLIYTAGKGWCTCQQYTPASDPTAWIKIPGRASYRKLYADTQAFRDEAVRNAAAKARKVGKW